MRLYAALSLLIILAACAGPRLPLPPAPSVEVLLQQFDDKGQRWQQLDAAAEVGIVRSGKYISTQQFMLLEKPDRFRIDVMTFFGQLAMQLTVDQGELQVFLNSTVPGKYYHGPASDEVLARFTRLPLSSTDLVRLLLYDPPQAEYLTAVVETTAQHYLLRLTAGNREQQFFFDEHLRLRRCVYLRDDEPLLMVDYDRIDQKDEFPRRVIVEMPAQHTKVSVAFSDIKLNQPAKASRFKLSPPDNALPLQLPEIKPAEERS